jgi:hypothetical protein
VNAYNLKNNAMFCKRYSNVVFFCFVDSHSRCPSAFELTSNFSFRYDHFAVLCEILPVGLMSAIINFLTIRKGCFDDSVLREGAKLMQCANGSLNINSDGAIGHNCVFPGKCCCSFDGSVLLFIS